MTSMPVPGVAVVADAGQAAAGAQPSAQAVSRFEQQLHSPSNVTLSYAGPSASGLGTHNALHSVMNDVGRLSEEFRVGTAAFDAPGMEAEPMSVGRNPTADMARVAESFKHTMSEMTHMTFTMVNINLVTTAERMTGENVRTLFQLS
jgi:hypothetical protein